MIEDYDICPKCRNKVLIGATRCMSCSAVLKTEEEQKAMIKNFMEQKKGFDKAALVKFILYMIAFGIIYYFFSEEIMAVIDYISNK